MITALVKKQGVLSLGYAKLEKLTPGPFNLSSWNKSEAQLRKQKGKGNEDDLLEEPGPKAKQETWFRKIFRMCAHTIKENIKLKKVVKRQAHKIDWMHARHPEAASYVPPLEEESEESGQEEIQEEDEGVDAATFGQGFYDATAGHAGASGSGGDQGYIPGFDAGYDPGFGSSGGTDWWQ